MDRYDPGRRGKKEIRSKLAKKIGPVALIRAGSKTFVA